MVGMFALKATCTLLISMQVQNPIYQLSGFLGYYRFPAVIPRMEMTIILLFTVLPICWPGSPGRTSMYLYIWPYRAWH